MIPDGVEPSLSWVSSRRRSRWTTGSLRSYRPALKCLRGMCARLLVTRVGVEPTSPAWKAGIFAARPRAHAAEGEEVEPSRLIARLFSKQLPSPIGLPFRKAAEAGIEPASRRSTVAFPYQHRTHRNNQSGRLDLNHGHRPTWMSVGRSCARGTRNTNLSHVLKMRPVGVEPTHPAWQAGRLPLHHGRNTMRTELSKIGNAMRS